MRAAEAFGVLSKRGKSPKRLMDLLTDKNELVRVAAVESLASIGDHRALPAVGKTLHDKSPLVRSYAAEAVGKLGSGKDTRLLTDLQQTEKDELVRVGLAKALYDLGKRDMLRELLNYLSTGQDYRTRCAAANVLAELRLNKTDKETTINTLRRVLRCEPTVATRSSIRSTLRELE